MTVAELIQELSCHDPDCEVRLAIQPSYPLQREIDPHAISCHEVGTGRWEDEDEDGEVCESKMSVVFITEGGEPEGGPYGVPREVFGY